MLSSRRFDFVRLSQRQRLAMMATLGAIAGLAVAGCAVGPNYQKPAASLEPFYSAPA